MSFDACPCSGYTLDRFVRPSVMAVLARNPEGLHGYAITQQLGEIAIFGAMPPDATGLYRALKNMEIEGYLQSTWDVEGSGPARRIYTLTESGWECLRQWQGTLKSYALNLERTLEFIENSLASNQAAAAT